jgi:hypothetical protein
LVRIGALTVFALLLLGLALLAYEDAEGDEDGQVAPVLVDPAKGTVQGVSLGATKAQAVARLGPAPPWNGDQSVQPLKEDWDEIGAPSAMPFPGTPDVLRYDHTTVVLENGRVISVVTAERGATTPGGVGVGDDLDTVREAYPTLRCWDAPSGGGHGTYPVCSGRLSGDRWLWFGRDPIKSISLASRRLG